MTGTLHAAMPGPLAPLPSRDGPLLFAIGGARSGKSRYAQGRAEARAAHEGLQPVYVATAQAFDDEMTDRIDRHRLDRGPQWLTLEAPIDLPTMIAAEAHVGRILLVDCLTLWLTNVMLGDGDVDHASAALMAALADAAAPVVMVSNEVGMSIVPDNALARRFRDEQGRLNQRIAAQAHEVVFLAAGLPLTLK